MTRAQRAIAPPPATFGGAMAVRSAAAAVRLPP